MRISLVLKEAVVRAGVFAGRLTIRQKLIGYGAVGLCTVILASLINTFVNEGTAGALRKQVAVCEFAVDIQAMDGSAKAFLKYYDTVHVTTFDKARRKANRNLHVVTKIADRGSSREIESALQLYGQCFDSIAGNAQHLSLIKDTAAHLISGAEQSINAILGGIDAHEADLQMEGGVLSDNESALLRIARDGRILFLSLNRVMLDAQLIVNDSSALLFKQAFMKDKLVLTAINEYAGILNEQSYITAAENYRKNIEALQVVADTLFTRIGEERRLIRAFDENQHRISSQFDALVKAAGIRVARARAAGIAFILVSLAVVAGIFIFLSMVMIASIDGPVKGLMKEISRLGEGDFSTDIAVQGTDELSGISRQLGSMSGSLRGTISSVTRNADDLHGASGALSDVSDSLGSNSSRMRSDAESVAHTLAEVASSVVKASDEAQLVSQAVQTVAAAIEEMSASLNEVARNCVNESKVTATAASRAQATREQVDKLQQSASTIGKVVVVISKIADRTKLLALNATIEAASAGDAGKGFTVVANEVKDLARQTAEATNEIKGQVEDMRANMTGAITAIGDITGIIEEINTISQTIVATVEEQSATINEIARTVNNASQSAGSIAENIRVSSDGIGNVSGRMDGVKSAAASTAEGVESIRRHVQQLAAMATGLKEVTARFKV